LLLVTWLLFSQSNPHQVVHAGKYTQEQQGQPSFPFLEQPQEHAYRLDHTTSTSGIKAHNNKESSAARPNFSF
jgi:hypothetical protein